MGLVVEGDLDHGGAEDSLAPELEVHWELERCYQILSSTEQFYANCDVYTVLKMRFNAYSYDW